MMSLSPRISVNGSAYPAGMAIFGASILIVLGLASGALEIGWAHLLPHSLWLFSVIVPGLWNMLASQWNDPIWREILMIVPLGLIVAGTAILLAQKRGYAAIGSRAGGRRDE